MFCSVLGARGALGVSAGVLFQVSAGALAGQDAPVPPPACIRMSFGAWNPPLDWRRAGHDDSAQRIGVRVRATRDSVFSGQAAANGRDEMAWLEVQGKPQLWIFPTWWPAGVSILFSRSFAAGAAPDTIDGDAMAAVADAAQRPPTSRARVIRAPCH